MPKILTEDQCKELLEIPYEEYMKLIITSVPATTTAADSRKFNERLIRATAELYHMVAEEEGKKAIVDKEFSAAKADAAARLAEAKIRAKHRAKEEKGAADSRISDLTDVDPSDLTADAIKAISERHAHRETQNEYNPRKIMHLKWLWEGLNKLGKRVESELVAFGIENKMNSKLKDDRWS